MKNLFFIITLIFFSITSEQLSANTLFDSLKEAYLNNPKLNAERANVRAVSEGKEEALGEFRPNVTISGYVSQQDNTQGTESNFEPSEQSLLIEQKIFQGFKGVANLRKEEKELELAKSKLKKIEQEILLSAAEAHTGLLLNRKKVKINVANIDLLERQVETDKIRLEKGDINLADLAQSEASLAGATAELIVAQNDLVTSKADFLKIIGKNLPESVNVLGKINLKLPKSLSEARKTSTNQHPDLKIAILEYEKSEEDIIIARSELSPSATLSFQISEQEDISSSISERTQQTFKATAKWPLYAGGTNFASLRKAKEQRKQKELLLQDSKKIINAGVTNAWSEFQSSKSVLSSVQSQVKAAEIANEGITQEYESGGNRTTLEIIQSRTILLEARLNLATYERNFLLSQFNLLSSAGLLTADYLNLKSN